MFDFKLDTQIKFGNRTRDFVIDIIKKENWSSVGLIVDHNIIELPIVSALIDKIDSHTQNLIVGKCAIAEPTYTSLEDIRTDFCHPSLQAVIAIGGGSALDMAKAMAVLVNNRKAAIEYRGFNKMSEPVLPVVAIPTTAGTGSEVTPNASFIDSEAKKKLGINGDAISPRYAILDPELTVSCPRTATISTAVDSMVHAVEAFAAKKTNHIARFFAKEGFNRVFSSLPELADNLDDINLRYETMYGAFLSGVALMHSGTGPAAAMSYPLGVHYQVPHGLGCGIFLPHVIRHNINNGYYDYAGLYDLNGNADGNGDKKETSHKFIDDIDSSWDKLSIPKSLAQFGVNEQGLPEFIRETMELKGALDQNPVPFYETEIEASARRLL